MSWNRVDGLTDSILSTLTGLGDTLLSGIRDFADKFTDTEAVKTRDQFNLSSNKDVEQYQPVKLPNGTLTHFNSVMYSVHVCEIVNVHWLTIQ